MICVNRWTRAVTLVALCSSLAGLLVLATPCAAKEAKQPTPATPTAVTRVRRLPHVGTHETEAKARKCKQCGPQLEAVDRLIACYNTDPKSPAMQRAGAFIVLHGPEPTMLEAGACLDKLLEVDATSHIWPLTYVSRELTPNIALPKESAKAAGSGAAERRPEGTAGANREEAAAAATGAGSGAAGKVKGATELDTSNKIIEQVNALFADSSPHLVTPMGRNPYLLLHGRQSDVYDAERLLSLIDAPWPQVQLDLWAIQLSGDKDRIIDQAYRITRQTDSARAAINLIQQRICALASRKAKAQSRGAADRGLLYQLSFPEALVYLASSDPSTVVAEVQKDLMACGRASRQVLEGAQRDLKSVRGELPPDLAEFSLAPPGLSHLRAAFEECDPGANARMVGEVCQARHECLDPPDVAAPAETAGAAADGLAQDRWEAAVRLQTARMAADDLSKRLLDAFAQDMRDDLLGPLLYQVTQEASGRDAGGTSLVGKAHLVVTSRFQVGLAPSVRSYVETTTPAMITKGLLDKALDTTNGEISKLLPQATDLERILVAAVLDEPTPTFTEVAPGIAIDVLPTVLPDGWSARLQLKARFGIRTTALVNADKKSNPQYTDVIESHYVDTDAVVSAFDLFNISSFAMTTTQPRPRYVVPVLGRLPLVGPAFFQWRRNDKVTHHESIILVNTMILPRDMDMKHLHGLLGDAPPAGQVRAEAR